MQIKIAEINELARQKIPFLFIFDYALQNIIVEKIEDCHKKNIFFKINNFSNFPFGAPPKKNIKIKKMPISFSQYNKAFEKVQSHLKRGNSFLVNLTQATQIELDMSLQEIFEYSRAKYQLYYKDQFVVFSPEIFVKIEKDIISSHPMKGTISADLPEAEKIILNDKKEMAEHTTIVDLIRNDLSSVAQKVWVDKFRYIEKIKTQKADLLQVSSQIMGILPQNWQSNLGEILLKLLPAGSISGAPKPQTLKIIEEAEKYNRGFYTGVFGVFDGVQE